MDIRKPSGPGGRGRAPFVALLGLAALTVLATRGGPVGTAAPAGDGPAVVVQTPLMGDVNCSGAVDAVDALQVLRVLAGLPSNAACMDPGGDVDCDGDRDAVDALKILRHTAGLPADTPGCTPIGDPLGPLPSSFDLIDEALANGDIDAETALTYKVFAVFGDGRLPPAYRGADSGGPPDGGVAVTQGMLTGVSPQTRAVLEPFLVPPVYAGSWLSPSGGGAAAAAGAAADACPDANADWGCFDGSTANVRVWWQKQYPGDEAKAQAIVGAMDSTIWPALTGLMGTPLSDAGATYDGGSGAVDIYLVDVARSMAIDHSPPGCKKTSAYINLARGASVGVLAHEFMHVLQWGFDVSQGCMYQQNGDYNWLAEATATWATDFVYPDSNEEHYIADWYMETPGKPLETADDRHEYGAYLLFQYLTKFYGSEQIIRTIWDNTTQYGSLGAVEQALPGGFEERWPGFTACMWNSPPADCFGQWDDLAESVDFLVPEQDFGMGAATESHTLELAADVEHMAASYRHFLITDDRVQSVVFKNSLAGLPHASVQALVKADGQWQGPSDWTELETVSFCRSVPGQHLEELVLIISNDDWENKGKLLPPEPPKLTAKSTCPATVTVSWDGGVADGEIQLWVIPEAASDLDGVLAQEGMPGYASWVVWYCSMPFQRQRSVSVVATEDSHYIAVYYWGTCVRDPNHWPDHPMTFPVTVTIQYADGRQESEVVDFTIGFWPLVLGPYDFGP